MVTIIPVASGKGGTGKSVFAVNLAASLALKGKTVILIDLDLGGSNLHAFLDIDPRRPGLGHFINRQESSLQATLVETDISRLYFIPGDADFPGTANIHYFMKKKLIKAIGELAADYVIADLGSGSSYNTIDFFLMSPHGVIVTLPEPTAIISGYMFVKTALYRLLLRSFPARSSARKVVTRFLRTGGEASDNSFPMLVKELKHLGDDVSSVVRNQLSSFMPKVVINMGRTKEDLEMGANLRDVSRKKLGVEMEYIGFLYRNSGIVKSVLERKPICESQPDSLFSHAVGKVADKLIARRFDTSITLFEADEDLDELKKGIERY